MSILFLIDNLLSRAINGQSLLLAARNLLGVMCMCCLKVRSWSKITLWYLQCSDQDKSVLLLRNISYLSLLFYFRSEKWMDSALLTLIAILHLANQVESSVRCLVIVAIAQRLFLLAAKTQMLSAKIAKCVWE